MGDYQPVNPNGVVPFTLQASAAITGGQFLDASGDGTVAPAAGTLHPVGIAAQDAANGAKVTIWPVSGVLHELPIKNTQAIAAGAPIIVDTAAAGRVSTGTLATVAAAGTMVGVCTKGGTGNAGGTVLARFIGTA